MKKNITLPKYEVRNKLCRDSFADSCLKPATRYLATGNPSFAREGSPAGKKCYPTAPVFPPSVVFDGVLEFYNFAGMQKTETLTDFYKRYPASFSPATGHEIGNFNVNAREFCNKMAPYNRRDYYKISLIIGRGNLHFADKTITIDRNALVFFNPKVPYSWEAVSEVQSGYFCLFTEDFIDSRRNTMIRESPLVQTGVNPVFFVNKKQEASISATFRKMVAERDSSYVHKYDLLRNYVNLIVHEALKLQPGDPAKHSSASSRITTLFIELLERQFPVDSLAHSLKLRTANDYAEHLAVHPNHLNRAVKEITGKTITEHISDRVIKEARALLLHTDWSVAEIAYSLGFENPPYFNNFFKKQTDLTPNSLRK